jgi:hypothetical protein
MLKGSPFTFRVVLAGERRDMDTCLDDMDRIQTGYGQYMDILRAPEPRINALAF